MNDKTNNLPLPADVLCRKLSTFRGLVDIARDVQAKGLIEYGEPLTVDSKVVVKTITGPSTVEEHREPLTTTNALDNAIREAMDAAVYAIAAGQSYDHQDPDVNTDIAKGVWQILHAVQTFYTVMEKLGRE